MADTKKFWTKNILLWTGWYFVASFLIFQFIFHFDILSPTDWGSLSRVTLRGFPGLAFAVLLFAALPVWLAGAIAIFKTGKPLFGKSKKEEKKDSSADASNTGADEKLPVVFPTDLPAEMRVPYSRLKTGQLTRGALDCKVVEKPDIDIAAQCVPTAEPATDMQLPEDFSFDTAAEHEDAPMFKELDWGNSGDDSGAADIKIETRGDKKFAIATHDDSDFWVADAENWFASGKTKPSPIDAVLVAAKEHDATPVLHLLSENIMDLDALKEKWGGYGILIIKDLGEL